MDIINDEDVREIIKKHKKSDMNFKTYYIKKLEGTHGFFGQHKILSVELNTGELCTFFLKLFPDMEPQKSVGEKYGVFTKEINNYKLFSKISQNYCPILETILPNCYLTKENLLLVFNNLKEEQYVMANKYEYLNYDLMVFVLRKLAVLHGASLVYEEKRRVELKKHDYSILDEHADELEELFYNDKHEEFFEKMDGFYKGIEKALEIYELQTVPRDLYVKVCGGISELVKPSRNFRNVISHGDIWCTNFLLRFNDDHKPMDCKFIDYQFSRFAPPAHDVLSMIYLSTSRDFRKVHLYELLGIYYSHLEKVVGLHGFDLLSILSFDDFLKSCEEQKAFAVIQACFYFPLILLEEEEMDELFSQAELAKEALSTDRSIMLTFTKRSVKFHERNKNSIIDLVELCNNHKTK